MNILEEILAHKKSEIRAKAGDLPLEEIKSVARKRETPPHFLQAIRSVKMGLIAEVKRKSPSAGVIRAPFDPAAIARSYEQAGAQAISVLMDEKYFGGSEDHFRSVREAVTIPVLYKEFVVDLWQVWHAASLSASAVLLIIAALNDKTIDKLLETCLVAKIEPLIEVHDEGDLERLKAWNVKCVGINNRNLRTFKVSLDTTFRLKQLIPEDVTLISESGVSTADDVCKLHNSGVHGVLVGEHLLRQDDLTEAVKALMGDMWAST